MRIQYYFVYTLKLGTHENIQFRTLTRRRRLLQLYIIIYIYKRQKI